MGRPNIKGLCPFYDRANGKCYLSEGTPETYTRENKCNSDTNCKTCANYEAWAKGSNYKNK
jgi:hypothetical protein